MVHRLILMRHGMVDDCFKGEDKHRPLSDEGKRLHKRMGEYLKAQKIEIDGIHYSPLKRAKESAELVFQSFPKASFKEEAALGEVFDSYTVLKHILKSNCQNTLLVGHEPTLALLATHLMQEFKPFKLDRSALVVLDFEKELNFGKGSFKFYLSPQDILN